MNFKNLIANKVKDPLVVIPALQLIIAVTAIAMSPARCQLKVFAFVTGLILLPAFLFIGIRKLLVQINNKFISNKTTKSMTTFFIKYLLPVLFMVCAYFASMVAFVGFAFSGPF